MEAFNFPERWNHVFTVKVKGRFEAKPYNSRSTRTALATPPPPSLPSHIKEYTVSISKTKSRKMGKNIDRQLTDKNYVNYS